MTKPKNFDEGESNENFFKSFAPALAFIAGVALLGHYQPFGMDRLIDKLVNGSQNKIENKRLEYLFPLEYFDRSNLNSGRVLIETYVNGAYQTSEVLEDLSNVDPKHIILKVSDFYVVPGDYQVDLRIKSIDGKDLIKEESITFRLN